MKSLRKAVVLALSLSLAMGGPLAEARPTQSSGSYKGGFSSQRSTTAKSAPSRSPSAAPAPSRGSFGSFGSRRAPEADSSNASGGSRSAMNRDMSQKTAQDNAVRTMDQRTAQQRRLPPSDPVMPRQAPPPQYGNTGGYNNNPGYNGGYNGGYRQEQSRPSGWGTAGAAAAGAVLGSVIAGGAHANQAPQQQQQQQQQQPPLPTNVPSDVGSIGSVSGGDSSTSPGMATVPNPMNPDAPATVPAPQVQEHPTAQAAERPAPKEESGIGWFGWVMLGLIGFTLYKFFTRRKVSRQGANYSLGD